MKYFIRKYVQNLTSNDVLKFASKNNVMINNTEAEQLLFYAKNNWEDLIYGDPLPIIKDLETKFDKSKSKIITDLFFSYKEKYKDYL